MDTDSAMRLVRPFYDMLNQPSKKDVPALARQCMADGWLSFSDERTSKPRDAFLQQVMGFGQLIPDLAWNIKEVLPSGDRIVVRSEASGTPVGDLFGVPASGKKFTIMTIDIHTVEDGKLVRAHHVEDWASALAQLSTR